MEIAAIVFFEKKRTNDKDSLSESINKKLTEGFTAPVSLYALKINSICYNDCYESLQVREQSSLTLCSEKSVSLRQCF